MPCPPHGGAAAGRAGPEVHLFPMRDFCGIAGSTLLKAMHEAQHKHPILAVWEPSLRLPLKFVEYVSAICADFEPQIRQEAVLLLKRYVWKTGCCARGQRTRSNRTPELQVVALTCAHLAMKHWRQQGIPEQKLHWLSRNAFTKQDFIDAEADVMHTLECNVHWDGVLLAEWVPLLLYQCEPLLAKAEDVGTLGGVAAHLADILAFQDELMSSYWPSELAAGVLHAAVTLCSKRFQRHTFTLRVGHLCLTEEERVVQLSERLLSAALGSQCAELILEGGSLSGDECTEQVDRPLALCESAAFEREPSAVHSDMRDRNRRDPFQKPNLKRKDLR